MKLSIESLKTQPHLLALISDEDLLTLGIDPKTMRKHFRIDLKTARLKANAAGGKK